MFRKADFLRLRKGYHVQAGSKMKNGLVLLPVLLFALVNALWAGPMAPAPGLSENRNTASNIGKSLAYDYSLLDSHILWLNSSEFLNWKKMLQRSWLKTDIRAFDTLNDYPSDSFMSMFLATNALRNDDFLDVSGLFRYDLFAPNTDVIFGSPAPFQKASSNTLLLDPVLTVQDQVKNVWSAYSPEPYTTLTSPVKKGDSALIPGYYDTNATPILEEPDYQVAEFRLRIKSVILYGVPLLLCLGALFRLIRLPIALFFIICWFVGIELYMVLQFIISQWFV